MAAPPSAHAFAKLFRDEGLTVVEVGDWEHHNRNHVGAWGPVNGVMIHHTVTSGSARTVQICRDGYVKLPGPLCHGVITKDGRVHLVGYGRTNHAGSGDPDVLAAVIAERALPADNEASTDGNARFYGFECENLGDGEDPWPAAQLDAIEKVSAAICRHHGWGAGSVIGHLEWQPGKVDPRGFSMQTMRGRIAARLDGNHPQEDDVTPEQVERAVLDVLKSRAGQDALYKGVVKNDKMPAPLTSTTRDTNPTWQLASIETDTNNVVRSMKVSVETQAATIDQLVRTVATLAAGLGDLDPAAIVAELTAAIESVTVRLDVQEG
jgi:hypothetical protein